MIETTQEKAAYNSFEIEAEKIFCTMEVNGFYTIGKRIIDVVLTGILLIILFPLFLVVAVLIKLESPGPIIFKQTRVGKDQKGFTIYKFRTMVDKAEIIYKEEMEKSIKDNKMIEKNGKDKCSDPKITRIGKVLRKLSIDEMPQFINVIKGDMSLVGPRPNLPYELEQYDKEWYKIRYKALPGISGLWQVSGRNALPFEKMMELDYEYVMKRSLWLDIKIILKTIPTVLRWYETR
ncbi:MAG: sugar transferase [Deltaproteobacteria bacterium]